ncbi:uncharacterized protein HD556DRAFT_462636 [Suillus plorans]|uniref:Uncharacterized protein n=1 Tax=Suillus plorans TaxID=116603 RepID=A0A9P7ARI8_9AGAM|nr:uncharacterized protein HD556DRAFT_462636 [Suillus plorans]KAG1793602.1 hypothetical protein HD556DRAFT_462636 [Suillus plorans]
MQTSLLINVHPGKQNTNNVLHKAHCFIRSSPSRSTTSTRSQCFINHTTVAQITARIIPTISTTASLSLVLLLPPPLVIPKPDVAATISPSPPPLPRHGHTLSATVTALGLFGELFAKQPAMIYTFSPRSFRDSCTDSRRNTLAASRSRECHR